MMSRGPLAPPPPPPPKTHMLSHKPQMEEKNIVGVPALLDDLYKLSHDQTTADMLFIVGPEEERFYCHKLILYARCSTFQAYKDEFFYSPKSHPYQQSYRFFRPEHFKSVLMYIYTGRLVLNYDNVVDILSIAQHLGLDDLQKNCEDFVARQLNLDNACLFLAAAMRMGQQFQGSSDNSFVERCAEYIEENAEECIHTESFLRLPKEALIRLVSSDQLALEENDVWRAVLAWAKQQTGINKPVSTWSEAEKGRVRVQMSGVIEHVKLLLIDSTVFAEEVEPTGAVPMEMSLERYRFAAVPDKVGDPHDKKLRPRLCVKLFHDTEILVRDRLQYQKQLSIWYGESKQAWKLIYRASRDGFSAQSFHTHCDGYCPTFIIVLGQRGNVCGGYSDVPWTSKAPQRGRYIASEKAFLFTLVNNQGVPPTKFGIANKKFATSHHPNFGPIFGAGADLCISSNCDTNMESYSNLPHSYTTDQASNSILMGDYNFTVADYEVFTICE